LPHQQLIEEKPAMTSLVTGGAGLLGSALVRKLLADGEDSPVVLDIAWSPDRLRDVKDKFRYIQGDIGNLSQVLSVVKETKPSRIYHIGAMLGQAAEDNPAGAIRINVLGTFYLLEAARLFGVPQVLFASSVSIFTMDLPERMLRDHFPKHPIAFYAHTKLFNEGTGEFFRRKYGIDFRAIRYPSIIGPGTRVGGILNYTADMINYSMRGEPYTADVDPNTTVAVVHANDAARALVDLANAPSDRIKTVNYLIDGVKPVLTAAQMADRIKAKIPGAKIDFKPKEELRAILKMGSVPIDDEPARSEWGWKPGYDYDAMIDDFLAQQ
jgi:threonine 3-dehydrogenase